MHFAYRARFERCGIFNRIDDKGCRVVVHIDFAAERIDTVFENPRSYRFPRARKYRDVDRASVILQLCKGHFVAFFRTDSPHIGEHTERDVFPSGVPRLPRRRSVCDAGGFYSLCVFRFPFDILRIERYRVFYRDFIIVERMTADIASDELLFFVELFGFRHVFDFFEYEIGEDFFVGTAE